MPEGEHVNLRIMKRDNLNFMAECSDRTEFWGEYDPIQPQISKTERLRLFDSPSQLAILTDRVLEKTGFKREETVRKSGFVRGEWVDAYLYCIPREEWMERGILAKMAAKH